MEQTIRVRSQRWCQGAEDREFEGLLRRYELREQAEGRIRTLGRLYLALSAVGMLSACAADATPQAIANRFPALLS